ncbi:CGNR zinc finger domain-containing protein [Paenibacillus sp. P26]|nr:CGNR zinc finger domain-containing protein [Paenibacillus sp. P26]UUZ92318.1 CGNR zinc finger domain-containing protein [Paenibacillus sp. P25]
MLDDLKQRGAMSMETHARLKERTESLALEATILPTAAMIYQGKNMIDHVEYQIIRSLSDTLERYAPERIRECEHEECILHFLDTSKSGKRRWCSMERCGNRHKAAEFYTKKKRRASDAHEA